MNIARAIERIYPDAQYRLRADQDQTVNDIIEWVSPGSKPTQAQLDTAWSQLQNEESQQQSTRDSIIGAANGAVGKSLSAITTAERNALLAVLMYNAGAVDRQGLVQSLNQWMK